MISIRNFIDGIPRWRFLFFATAIALISTCVFYSPRFENWTRGYPYSWETFRGAGFLMQTESPLRTDIEPALRWRLLVPTLAWAIGLRGAPALLLPFIGLIAMTLTTGHLMLKRGASRIVTALGIQLIATTSASIIGISWLGVNDAWVWCGLITLTLSDDSRTRTAWAWLGPWIDERMLIGMPLAILLNAQFLRYISPGGFFRRNQLLIAGAAFYVAARLCGLAFGKETVNFWDWTMSHCHEWIPTATLGWWNGLRMAWLTVFLALILGQPGKYFWLTCTTTFVTGITIIAMIVLAADLSRSASIVLPASVAGMCHSYNRSPKVVPWLIAALVVLNLILPAATVVGPHVLYLESFWRHNLHELTRTFHF